MTGLVVKIAKTGRSVLLRHHSVRVWIHFAAAGLPVSVKYGARISVIGYLRSYNIGTAFALGRCSILRVSPLAFMRAGFERYPDAAVLDPEEEIEEREEESDERENAD